MADKYGIGPLREWRYGAGLGSVSLEPASDVVAGQWGTWRVTYRAGTRGVARWGRVRLLIPNPFTEPQVSHPVGLGYTAVTCSNPSVALELGIERPALAVTFFPPSVAAQVTRGCLAPGDTLIFTYGAGPSTTPSAAAQFLACRVEFTVMVDAEGTGEYELVPGCPQFRILPDAAARLIAYLPSTVAVGERFALRLVARDRYGNVATGHAGRVRLSADGVFVGLPPEVIFGASDGGIRLVEGLALNAAGPARIRAEDRQGALFAESNPIEAHLRPPAHRLLWGDPHVMTGLCVGEYNRDRDEAGILDDMYVYARDASGLDFAAATSLGERMTDEQWAEVRRAAARVTEPGRFVAFSAYEYFGKTVGQDGNRNVYYLDDDQPCFRSTDPATDHPTKLWAALRGRRAMTVPHHSHNAVIGTRWLYHDPELNRLAEIYSIHGLSERPNGPRPFFNPARSDGQSVQDALAKGYRLGIIAGSDSHTGQPGYSNRLRLSYGYHGGLAAVWATALTRQAIWDALYNRRCYGTTGARIILRFALNGRPMGEELRLPARTERVIEAEVIGTAPVARLEVVKNNRDVHRVTGQAREIRLRWTDPAGPEQEADFYYLRVTQADDEMAWSSPIWVART
jgi:hypothetical protein